MSVPAHIHMIDGKQVPYPNDNCPICGTAKAEPAKTPFMPKAYRKGNTVVTRASKLQIGTDTYWGEKNVILHSMKQPVRDGKGGILRTADGKFMWTSITFRMTLDLAKQYVAELSKLIQDVSGGGNVPARS